MNGTSGQANWLIELMKIFGTALLSGLFTYWITFKKDREEKRYHAHKELLEKVYTPIMKVTNSSIYPGEGYEGLSESDASEIIEIIEEHINIVDPRLDAFAWSLKEDLSYTHYSEDVEHYYPVYDEDRQLLNYLDYRYNYLRKKTYLPYDPQHFFFRQQFRKVVRSWDKLSRRLNRTIRRWKNKLPRESQTSK